MQLIKKLSWSFAATLASASVALAVEAPSIPNPTEKASFGEILATVISALLLFAGAIAVLFLIVGGFRYVVSAGNAEQVEGAKKTILYAVLGLIIIMIAFLLVNFILVDLLGVNDEVQPQQTDVQTN